MQMNFCNVLAEKDPGEIFTIAGWPIEIYNIILLGMEMGSNMKLR